MTPNEIAKLFDLDEAQTVCLAAIIERYAKEQVDAAMMIHRVAEAVKCGMCGND